MVGASPRPLPGCSLAARSVGTWASPQGTLRRALQRLPAHQLDAHAIAQQVEQAVPTPARHTSLHLSLLATAIREVSPRRRDLVAPLLAHGQPLAATATTGRNYLFNAALEAAAVSPRSDAPSRLREAESVLAEMREAGCAPGQRALRLLFAAARHSHAQPLELLRAQMERGLPPKLPAFHSMLDAISASHGAASHETTASHAQTASPQTASLSNRVPLLLEVLRVCQLRPNGRTVELLLPLCRTSAELAQVGNLLPPRLRQSTHHRSQMLRVLSRVDLGEAARLVLRDLMHNQLPSQSSLRVLLVSLCRSGNTAVAHHLCESLWRRRLRLSERTALELLGALGWQGGGGAGAHQVESPPRTLPTPPTPRMLVHCSTRSRALLTVLVSRRTRSAVAAARAAPPPVRVRSCCSSRSPSGDAASRAA